MKRVESSLLEVVNQEKQRKAVMSLLKKDLYSEETCFLKEEHIHLQVFWLKNKRVIYMLLDLAYRQRVWISVKSMMLELIHGIKLQTLIQEETSTQH